MPPLPTGPKKTADDATTTTLYPRVDLSSTRWPVALIREVLTAVQSDRTGHLALLKDHPVTSGRDALLVNLGRQLCAIAALDHMSAGERTPVQLRIEIAALLAGMAEDVATYSQLVATLKNPIELQKLDSTTLGKWLGKHLESVGKRLLLGLVPDDHPLLDTAFHRMLLSVERRLCDRATVDFFAGVLTRIRLRQHILQAREEKMSAVEAVIGLSWADGTPSAEEKRLIATLIEVARFDGGEKTMLRSTLDNGDVSLERIIDGIHSRQDALRLLEVLVVTAFIDGHFSPDEKQWIDRLALKLGVTEEEAASLDMRVAEQLSRDRRLREGITTSRRIRSTFRHRSNAIEHVIRRNIDAIATELLQTGDLLQLLAKSVRQPLTAAENQRMKRQLVDLCKAVPALALFAAPGGSLLLPLLAKALPFSLAPSSFRDDEEAAF